VSSPADRRQAAASLGAAALGQAKFPLLVVRRSRRHAGFGLLMGSLVFGFSVAVVWSAFESGDNLGGPLLFLAVAAWYGVQTGKIFRDDSPKLVVERAGLGLPGVAAAPIPWTRIAEIRVAAGFLAWGGGRIDLGLDGDTFAGLELGQRWMGDPVVKRAGSAPVASVLAASLDTDARKILDAMRQYWPPEEAQ
jgi:hypothetical protein